MNKTTSWQNLLFVNKSKFKENEYYAKIKPEVISAIAEGLKLGQVKLTKEGYIDIKGYKNQNKETGATFISLKWIRPDAGQAPVNSYSADKPDLSKVDLEEDIPF